MKTKFSLLLVTAFISLFGAVKADAASGAGTMTVSPTSVTAGSTGNTLTFQFRTTATGGAYTAGSYATVVVPSGWTVPQTSSSGSAGYVSVAIAGTATASIASISGSTITINFTCSTGTGNGFTLTYAAATADTLAAVNPFTTATRLTAGTPTVSITTQPTVTIVAGVANAAHSTLSPATATLNANGTSTQVLTVQARDLYNNNLTAGGSTVVFSKSSGTGTVGSTTDNANGTYTATVTAPSIAGSGTFAATLGGTAVGTAVSASSSVMTYVYIVNPGIALRATYTGYTNLTAGTTLAIPKPTGVVAGDVMIVNICQAAAAGTTFTGPTCPGWTLIDKSPLGGSVSRTNSALYRIAGATENLTNNYTFTLNGSVASYAAGAICAFSGVDTTGGYLVGGAVGGPFDVAPGTITVNAAAAVTAATITTASANAAVILLAGTGDIPPLAAQVFGTFATATSPGALTTLYSYPASSAGASYVGGAWALKTTAGATGAGSATSSQTHNGGLLLALKPLSVTITQVAFTTQPVSTTAGSTLAGVVVQLQDAGGNAVAYSGVPITLTLSANSFASGTVTVNTDSSGKATFNTLVINTAATGYTLSAAASGLTGATSSSFNITASAVTAAQSTVSASPTSVTADGTTTSTVTVTLKDAYGNPVSGKTVTLAKSTGPGSPTITTTQGTTDASGVATFTVKSTTAGADVFAATDVTDSSLVITQTATVTFTPGAATHLVFVQQPTTTTAGVAISPSVTVYVEDANGNVVTTDSSSITIGSSTTGFTGSTLTVAAINGVATFTGIYPTTAGSANTLTASDGSLTGATSGSFTVNAAAASKLVITSSAVSTTAGVASSAITVQRQDQFGNPTTLGGAISLTMSSTSTGTKVFTAASPSIASGASSTTFTYSDTLAGTPTITAAYTGLTSATQQETVTAGAATKLVFTSSAVSTVAGVASTTITVQRQDAYGNPNTTDASRTVTLSSSSAGPVTFTPASPLTIANGSSSASFTYADTVVGTPTITAASTSPSSITSATQIETVTKATPAISGVANVSRTYGTASFTLTGTVSATGGVYPASGETVSATINGHLVNGTVNNSTGGFSITYNDASLATDGVSGSPYTITYAYGGNANLNAAPNNTSTALTISAAPLQITANSASKTYGATYGAVGSGQTAFTSTGLHNSDSISSVTITATSTPVSGTAATAGTGTYSLTPSAAAGTGLANYSITYTAGTLTVNPATLTVSPNAYSGVYDGSTLVNATYSDTLANYAISGYQNSDTATSISLAFSGSMALNGSAVTTVHNAGTYTLAIGTLALTSTGNNYVLNFENLVPHNYVITPKPLTVTGITASTKTADGTTAATLVTSGAALVGVVSGGGALSNDTANVTLVTSGATGTFDTAAAGTGKTVTVSGLTITGSAALNYTVTQPTTTATINPGAIDHYVVTFSTPPYLAGVAFTTYATAKDAYGNTVTTDSSTMVTFSSTTSANVKWDANNDGTWDRTPPAEIQKPLVNGVASIPTKDDTAENGVTVTATDITPKTGTSPAIDINTGTGAYRSASSGNWSAIGTWQVYDPTQFSGDGWGAASASTHGYNHTPTSADGVVTIQSGHSVTNDVSITVDELHVVSGAGLVVNSGVTLTLASSSTKLGLELYGQLVNNGTVSVTDNGSGSTTAVVYDTGVLDNTGTVSGSTTANLIFYGGTYQHNPASGAGTVPTATWQHNSINSTCEILGSNNGLPAGLGQPFQNFIWDCASQSGYVNLGSGFAGNVAVTNFTVISTGTGSLTLGADLAVGSAATIDSGAVLYCGTQVVSGGSFTLAGGATLGIGSAVGITATGSTGNIQTTTRSFSTAANYIYTGTGAKASGSGLPATVNSLTDNNTGNTLTLAQAETVTTTLTEASTAQISLPAGTTSTAANFVVSAVTKAAGSWGSTSSTANHTNNTYFASTTGLLNVGTGVVSAFSGLTASQSITYGADAVTLSGTLSAPGPVYPADGETITITINGTPHTTTTTNGNGSFTISYPTATLPVGSPHYDITYSYAGSDNLNPATDASTTLTVNPAALTITANDDSKTYGGTKSYGSGSTAFTSSALKNGETIGTVTITAGGGTAASAAAGTYSLTPSAATGGSFNANNYSITYSPGTLTVRRASLAITANNRTKFYGAALALGTSAFTPVGLQNSETVGSVALTASGSPAGDTASAAVGSYTITPGAAAGGSFTAANYNITYNTGTLDVIAPALKITAATGTPLAGAADNLTISFVDSSGAAVTTVSGDFAVTFSGLATAGDGTHPTVTDKTGAAVPLGTATTITFVNGVSTAGGVLKAYQAEGPVTLTGADGISSTSDTGGSGASLTVSAAASSKLLITSSAVSTLAGVASSAITVQRQDQYDNPNTTDATISLTMSSTSTGTTTFNASSPSIASGSSSTTFTYTDTQAGTPTITAARSGLTSATQQETVTFAAASQLVVTTQPSPSTVAGVAFAQQPVVKIEDQYGNVVTSGADSSRVVTAALTTGAGTLSGTLTATASAGVATFSGNNLSINLIGADKVLTFTTTGGAIAGTTTSPAFAITAAAATHLVYTTVPATGTAGTAFSVTVASEDQFGNPSSPTSDTTITLSKATGGGALSGTLAGIIPGSGTSVTISTPVYSKSDTMTLTASATAGETGLTAVTSGNIVFSAGAATHLVFGRQPTTTTAGSVISPSVTVYVEDANGNVVTTDSSSVSINGTSFTGGSTRTVSAVNGVATFDNLAPTTAGSGITLVASDNALAVATSDPFAVYAAAASHLEFTVQPSASTVAGVAFATQPVVRIEDAYENVVTTGDDATRTVTLTLTTGAGTLGGTVSIAAVNGVADFSGKGLSIDKVGINKVLTATATVSGSVVVTAATSPAFTITLPPVNILRGPGAGIKIYASNLLITNALSDTYTLTYVSCDAATANLVALAISHPASDTRIVYPSSAENVADSFHYTISDSHGDTWTGTVNIGLNLALTGQKANITVSGGVATMMFFGVPGYHYAVQRTEDINGETGWADITVTSDASVSGTIITVPSGGAFTVTDNSAPGSSAYYRLRAAP